MSKSKEVILGVTGSIAAYKACEIVNHLKRGKAAVTAVMTKEAQEFITPLTLQTLTGQKVVSDLFVLPEEMEPAHISLAQKADLVLIAPATANIIAKLSAGIADDVLTSLCLATRAPIVICPAMNDKMYTHKITQEHIARLKKLGYRFIGPQCGRLVCGREGPGHLAKVGDIVKQALELL